ncbi:MAG TPA: hypothetical protein VD816_01050 [Ohtaekwangia sp.]|nr:hypothetical protein [Ohtaekwangia sp.]
MKKIYLAFVLLGTFTMLNAQDEGNIVKKERLSRDRGVFIGGGPSFTLGKNIGDYSKGINFEIGYLKRLNRVLSIGPSVSYIKFDYDPKETGINALFIGGPYSDGYEYHEGLYFDLKGGDLSFISAAFNLKVNFIPVTDNSKISVYGFVRPFISYASRTKVTGVATYLQNYGNIESEQDWFIVDQFEWTADDDYVSDQYGLNVTDEMKEENKITGGIFIGPGVEFMPAKGVSVFVQASIGYTFPVSYISTKSFENSENYGNDLDVFLQDGVEEYPMTSKGFPSVNLQAGVTFNF